MYSQRKSAEQQLKSTINLLAKSENPEKKHLFATMGSQRDDEVGTLEKQLDVLARVLVSEVGNWSERDVCIAVCQWVNSDKKEFFVASNKGIPFGLEKRFPVLREFANQPTKDNYWKLAHVALCHTRILVQTNSTSNENSNTGVLRGSLTATEKFKRHLQNVSRTYDENIVKEALRLAEEASKELLERGDSPEWKYLLLLDDVNIISNAILKNDLDGDLLRAIKEGLIKPVSGVMDSLHAEMKIVEKLFSINSTTEPESSKKTKKSLKKPALSQYIGISKLSCAPCWMAIQILDERNKIKVRGTHGSCYENWQPPQILSERELEKMDKMLLNCRVSKSWESTSEIKSVGLTTVPEMNTDDMEDVVQQIEILPKKS